MSEVNTTVTTPDKTGDNQERTFTQSEMNAIFGERLARERAKYADYEDLKAKATKYDEAQEASKSELQKATEKVAELQGRLDAYDKAEGIRTIREKVAAETGVPINLLTAEDEENCKKQASAIIEFAKPQNNAPKIKDGGEVIRSGGSASTRDMFAEAFNKSLGIEN